MGEVTAEYMDVFCNPAAWYPKTLDTCVTSGFLPFALRASLWLFKIAPGDFVAGMTLSGVFAGSMKTFTHSIWGRAILIVRPPFARMEG